jgi:hypothetical protein
LQEGQELVWCSKRFCRDVAPEVRAFKLDALHGGIGGGLHGAQIFAERGQEERDSRRFNIQISNRALSSFGR